MARGKRLLALELGSEALSDDELGRLVIGRSGNLRAPTLELDDGTFVVGFHPESFERAGLCGSRRERGATSQ